MEQVSIQQRFFQHVRNQLPPHLSLAEEVASLLGISTDSAYRRIRAEKPLTFEEIQKISSRFRVSLDQFLSQDNDTFLFWGRLGGGSIAPFSKYLEWVLQNFHDLKQFSQKHVYFMTKDIPFFGYYQAPRLCAFKFFLWMKLFHFDEVKGQKFCLDRCQPEQQTLAKQIVRQYNQIPTTEIWNIEGINISIRQIEYYYESGLFESRRDVLALYEDMELLINHFEKQAELGRKFTMGEPMPANAPEYRMFYNELAEEETILVDLGESKITYLVHSIIEFIATTDPRFNDHVYSSLMNLVKKSTQLSTVGEKDRIRFFNKLREKVCLARKNFAD